MIDYKLAMTQTGIGLSFQKADSLFNNVYLSTVVRRGSLIGAPWFGSRMHLIESVSADSLLLARDFCMEAYRWMIPSRAKTFTITTNPDVSDKNRINLAVIVTRPTDAIEPIEFFYPVV